MVKCRVFMQGMMSIGEEKYIQQLKELVLNRVDCRKVAVFLFGGRARGRQGKAVDIDIGLLSDGPLPIDLIAALYDTIEESSIPYKVDFVDFSSVDELFLKIAMENIVIWNQPATIKIK